MTRTLLLAGLALTLAACQTPDTADPVAVLPTRTVSDPAADRAAIEALTADYTAAVRAGDADAIAAVHTDDAVLHPPNEPSVRGREAVDAYLATAHAEPLDQRFMTEDVAIAESGDLAYEVGTWDGGKYLTVWRRTPDGWRIAADAWSEDAPPTASN